MTLKTRNWRPAIWLAIVAFVLATAPARAAGLQPGEYACAGAGGIILIGLGFRLFADGTYTDLDGKSKGHVAFSGSTVRFIGGHLDGYVGVHIRNGTDFEIDSISCSHV